VLFGRKPSLARFHVLLRRAHDASVMLFGARDRETHSVGKRLSAIYCPAQLTWSFQSTNGPWGLSRHAQTCSSKNGGRP
jgi:hypothetical protein